MFWKSVYTSSVRKKKISPDIRFLNEQILYQLGSICKLQLEISNLGHSLREWELHQFQDL